MKSDGLGKLYDRLTPDERFRLAVGAMVREDTEEIGRLAETCPRVRYTMMESAYADRIRTSTQMTATVCLYLAPLLVKVETLRALKEGVSYVFDVCIAEADLAYLAGEGAGARRSWLVAGKTGNPPDNENDIPTSEEDLRGMITVFLEKTTGDFLGRIEELERRMAKDALIAWRAFARFCDEELLVEPERLVEALMKPMLPEIARLKNLPNQQESDQEQVDEYTAALKRGWRESVR